MSLTVILQCSRSAIAARIQAQPLPGETRPGEVTIGEFDCKAVIVTGGAYGIGGGTALAFAREGANAVVSDMDLGASKAVVAEIAMEANIASTANNPLLHVYAVRPVARIYGSVDTG